MATIKKITLDNYKSFGHLEFDLSDGKNTLPYAFVYGENGSGKTNLLETIGFLKNSVLTLAREPESASKEEEVMDTFGKMVSLMRLGDGKDNLRQTMMDILIPKDLSYLTARYKMADSEEGMGVKIVLDIDGHDAAYSMRFGKKDTLVEETLNYLANERVTDLFRISCSNNGPVAEFSPSFFKDSTYGKNIKEVLRKYWGKHSFLSVMNYERIKNNTEFMKQTVTDSLFTFVKSLMDIRTEDGPFVEVVRRTESFIFNPLNGFIRKERLDDFRMYETALNKAFTRIYSDVRKVYFRIKEANETELYYTLYFVKHIHGKDREIPASSESSGTLKFLSIFPYLLDCASGRTVMIDEMDSGIHDKLVFDLIQEILGEVKGQLIISTHNTSLLKILNPRNVFIINVDLNGDRDIRTISSILKTQKNNNNQDRYLKGLMDGVPYMGSLDLDEIVSEMNRRGAQ